MNISIGIADDQQLFLKSLSVLIDTFDDFEVIVEALNGEDLLQKLAAMKTKPDVLLIDVSMPVMDGIKTAEHVSKKYPFIKMVALSSKDDDMTIISMIAASCCSYLLKDIHPNELERALLEIHEVGYYNADECNRNCRRLLKQSIVSPALVITDKEKQFLQLACTDLTYKAIANKMFLAERTIDGYRESLFQKLNVQSRVGMVMEGVRRNLISL
ncbi:MAG: response regulator transcription factor [Williamsia sp.]|nr:response regulator transcription factor [Williamsia sp.]